MVPYREVKEYIDAHAQETRDLLLTLAQIPSPSNHEEKRAEFCKKWLEDQGAKGVYMDQALNVIYPIGLDTHEKIVVFMAHTDVVFPDTTPLPLVEKDGKICCPGVGDDTANVAALLMVAKYLVKKQEEGPLDTELGILLVCNSGEEGLGNLKGSRAICEAFGSRIDAFYSFDLGYDGLTDRAVGSARYEVEIKTIGGHSFAAFGNPNAIALLSDLVCDLYKQEVPKGGTTTYNVGTISGGTSVNTIAQQASIYYEYRSDVRENLAMMEQQFNDLIAARKGRGIDISVRTIGIRPCEGDVDPVKREAMLSASEALIHKATGIYPKRFSCSTDCNIPLSMGIPAVCYGTYLGAGAHTREEYVESGSLVAGYEVAFRTILAYTGGIED